MQQTNNMIDSVHNLENAGMNRPQAEALTKLVRDSVTEAVTEAVSHLATKAEVAELRTQVLEVKAGLAELTAAHKTLMERTDSQIALLRGDVTEKIGAGMKYMAISVGFSTVAIIAAIFAALFAALFATPVSG